MTLVDLGVLGGGDAGRRPRRVFVVSAGIAWYTCAALLLHGTTGRMILPVIPVSRHQEKPGAKPAHPMIQLDWAEPGVKHGQ